LPAPFTVLVALSFVATCQGIGLERSYDEPESTAREISRRLLATKEDSDAPRGPSRRLLDHTVTHNIEMLKDVREYERLQMLAQIEKYQDAYDPVTFLGRKETVSQGPTWDGEDMTIRMVLNQIWWEWGGYEWTSHLRFPGKEWRKPTHYCTWYGISCNDKSEISTIQLEANNLIGTIPEVIGELDSLVELHLGYNEQLTGPLPEAVGKLTKLSYLSIPYTGLSGYPPASLSNLDSLNYVDFRYNSDWYYPEDIRDSSHEIRADAKAWNEVHKLGRLTTLTGYDPFCVDGGDCTGTTIAIGTYWSQSQLALEVNSWTTRGRYGTIDDPKPNNESAFELGTDADGNTIYSQYSGCSGEWCNEMEPGVDSSPQARPDMPYLDTTNSVDPGLETMTPLSMG